jgi:hypothetical protein
VALILVDLVDVDTAVQQPAGRMLVGGRLNAGCTVGILCAVVNSTEQGWHERLHRTVHLIGVRPELACDVIDRNLGEEIIEICHISSSVPFVGTPRTALAAGKRCPVRPEPLDAIGCQGMVRTCPGWIRSGLGTPLAAAISGYRLPSP